MPSWIKLKPFNDWEQTTGSKLKPFKLKLRWLHHWLRGRHSNRICSGDAIMLVIILATICNGGGVIMRVAPPAPWTMDNGYDQIGSFQSGVFNRESRPNRLACQHLSLFSFWGRTFEAQRFVFALVRFGPAAGRQPVSNTNYQSVSDRIHLPRRQSQRFDVRATRKAGRAKSAFSFVSSKMAL